MPSILWLRQDLRLADHPALMEALKRRDAILPVFIWDPQTYAPWMQGEASRWWLERSLCALASDLHALGSQLLVYSGDTVEILQRLVQETGAQQLFYSSCYEPAARQQEAQIHATLRPLGVRIVAKNANYLFSPQALLNKSGKPFQVFGAFWKACLQTPEPALPESKPQQIAAPASWPKDIGLKALAIAPKHPWRRKLEAYWQPGEVGALRAFKLFGEGALANYALQRDVPAVFGTSRLSPHLHFGEISPRQIWHALAHQPGGRSDAMQSFLRELGWREFATYQLFHFPQTPTEPLRQAFRHFPWQSNEALLKAWQRGETGYPIVDAGMRELWETGTMHNRVRMIVASFLVKDLLIPWQQGAAWFWDTLVDADLAQNTMNWQWVAGCGADAAPFFRIFNPVLQGEKFDPEGLYVKHWLPELLHLPQKWVHQPWKAPESVLKQAGIKLAKTYPLPIVDHAMARDRALEAFRQLKKAPA